MKEQGLALLFLLLMSFVPGSQEPVFGAKHFVGPLEVLGGP